MAWVRRLGPAVLVVAAVATVVVGLAAVLVVGPLGRGAGVVDADRLRRALRAGVEVPVPTGWRDRANGHPSVVVELEQRELGGLVATRGLWVSRWTAGDPAADVERWRAEGGDHGPSTASTVGGRDAVHRVDRLGPVLTDRLPAFVAMRRSIHRLVAYDRVYEVGFWGPASSVGDGVERAVLAGFRFHEPAAQRLLGGGWAVDVPGRWDRGAPGSCAAATACAFAPPMGGSPPAAWVYVFDWPGTTLDAAGDRLVASLRKGGALDVHHEPAELDGRPVVRVRFGYPEDDGSVSSVEELLVGREGGDGFAVVALGWRTAEGRTALDSVVGTIRPYHPAP